MNIQKKRQPFLQQKGSREIIIDRYADVILFTHATDNYAERVMWQKPKKVGEYVFTYDDGTTYTHTLSYGENIFEYGKCYAQPIPGRAFRHEGYIGTYMAMPICGKDNSGRDFTLYKLPVKNAHPPEKHIEFGTNISHEQSEYIAKISGI